MQDALQQGDARGRGGSGICQRPFGFALCVAAKFELSYLQRSVGARLGEESGERVCQINDVLPVEALRLEQKLGPTLLGILQLEQMTLLHLAFLLQAEGAAVGRSVPIGRYRGETV